MVTPTLSVSEPTECREYFLNFEIRVQVGLDRLLLLRLWLDLMEMDAEEKRWLEPTTLSEMKIGEG